MKTFLEVYHFKWNQMPESCTKSSLRSVLSHNFLINMFIIFIWNLGCGVKRGVKVLHLSVNDNGTAILASMFFDFINRATMWCSHMLQNVMMSIAIKCVKRAVMMLVKISAFVRLILY